ncbi:hypothetical protein DHEL01_v206101 [Diaporthe helianthi]|uniref:Amidohydrolase-related domain-containing protein n=1 Tax=Diaporthe helianthi TaxID=158607 RepID=A0A2P5HZ31_DIAHE|nr:hypothetical protein DHEL01_v206101 [Diaporthe helianthi]
MQQTLTQQSQGGLICHGGWDTHHHIFEPATFPYSASRHLTPPPATVEEYIEFRRRLGLSNSVLTHGLSYGDDCTSMKSFIPRLGASTTRGIGVIDPDHVTDDHLREMNETGVRGVRVNLYHYGAMEDVEAQKRVLSAHGARLSAASLPWSVTMTTTRTEFWDELRPYVETTFSQFGLDLVTDHFALLKGTSMLPEKYKNDPTAQPGFKAVVELVRSGRLWVKLSAPYRVSGLAPTFHDLEYLVRALVGANKYRVLWGSDWPHTPRMKIRSPEEALKETPYLCVDDEAWLRMLRSWLSDEEWHLLMVENPGRLFEK